MTPAASVAVAVGVVSIGIAARVPTRTVSGAAEVYGAPGISGGAGDASGVGGGGGSGSQHRNSS